MLGIEGTQGVTAQCGLDVFLEQWLGQTGQRRVQQALGCHLGQAADSQHRLGSVGVKAGAVCQFAAQRPHGPAQRRVGVAKQRQGQHVHGLKLGGGQVGGHGPGQQRLGRSRVGDGQLWQALVARSGERLCPAWLQTLECAVQQSRDLGQWPIAIQVENGVGRHVMLGMKGAYRAQIESEQARLGTASLVGIGGAREQGRTHRRAHPARGVTQCPAHLVVDHARDLPVRAEPPSFLPEDLFTQQRMKDRVQEESASSAEVGHTAAGDGEGGPVWSGAGIQVVEQGPALYLRECQR